MKPKATRKRHPKTSVRKWIDQAKLKTFKRYEVEWVCEDRILLPGTKGRIRIVDKRGVGYYLMLPPDLVDIFAKKIVERRVECERLLKAAGI
jgi:hypothetical protein